MVILLSVVPLAVPANVIFVIEIVQGRHGVVFIRATVVTNQLYLQKRAFTASHVFMRACSGNLRMPDFETPEVRYLRARQATCYACVPIQIDAYL